MLKQVIMLLSVLLFIDCGGGSSSSPDTNESIKNSFKNKPLYSFKLNFVDHRQRYDLTEIDGINSNLIYKYFDFNSNSYEVDTKEQQIFVNGKRGAMLDATYRLKDNGSIESDMDGQKIFQFILLAEDKIKIEKLEEYSSNIAIEGKVYKSKLSYLSNFYKVKDLLNNSSYDNLEAFVEEYQSKTFEGSVLNGLAFGENNTFRQRTENNSSSAGTYSIEKIDNKNVLFLHPNNTQRYGKYSCYILDFSRVWKAECHLKDSHEFLNFYDRDIYDDVLEYMQNNFTDVKIEI